MPETGLVDNRHPTRRHRILTVLLVVVVCSQLGILLTTQVIPLARAIYRVRTLSALDRSAVLAFGEDFASYMSFLRTSIPVEGRAVLPPVDSNPVLGHVGMMQYFLFPRDIVNCPGGPDLAQCVRSMDGASTYILRVNTFPNPADVPANKSLLPFDARQGVYALAPPASGGGPTALPTDLRSQTPVSPLATQTVAQWVVGILLLLGVILIGGLLAAGLRPDRSAWQLSGTFFPVGLGLVTWMLFCLSRLGMALTWMTIVPSLAALLLAGVLLLRVRRSRLPSRERAAALAPHSQWLRPIPLGLLILLVGVFLVVAAFALGQSYSEWDSMAIWSVKGYGIALQATVLAAGDWGAHGITYPLNIPIGIAVFRILQGDTEPLSKLLFPLIYASLVAGCVLFWTRRGVPTTFSALGGILVASVPLVFDHGSNGYANLAFASYLVLGTLCLVEGLTDGESPMLLLAGILLGFACWTRAEAVGYVLVILGLGFGLSLVYRIGLHGIVIVSVPVILIYAPWWIVAGASISSGIQGHALSSAWLSIRQGILGWEGLATLVRAGGRHLATPATWGFLLPASAFLLVWGLVRPQQPPDRTQAPLIAAAALTGALTAGIFYIRSFTLTGTAFGGLLVRSLDRHLLPALILLAIAAVLAAREGSLRPESTRQV